MLRFSYFLCSLHSLCFSSGKWLCLSKAWRQSYLVGKTPFSYSTLLVMALMSTPHISLAHSCRDIFAQPLRAAMPARATLNPLPADFDFSLFPTSHASRVFVEMARHHLLLEQSAPDLSPLGLLPPNHGLCASTCATNLIGAITAQYETYTGFRERAPTIVNHVVETYTRLTGQDARLAAMMDQMADVIVNLFPELAKMNGYYSFNEHIQLQRGRHMYQELFDYRIFMALKEDSIAIGAVKALDPIAAGISLGHAIIVLKVDTTKKHLYISDPNNPNFIRRIPYHYTSSTHIAFRVPDTFGPHLVEFYQLTPFTRQFVSQK